MTPAELFNEDQRTRWNGVDGEFWAREQDRLDRLLQPVLAPLMDFAGVRAGSTVLDIGCGCGATTIEVAKAVGPAGKVLGLDISEPMLSVAQARMAEYPQTRFLAGDAAELDLTNVHAELLISRFGVMFFGDPVHAFVNQRTGLAPGGRVRFACWRPMPENPWLHVPLQAACEHVPRLPKPDPEEPGPFAFGDTARVTRILTAAGFTAPSFTKLDVTLDLAAGGSLEDAVFQSTAMGPTKKAMKDQPEELRLKAMDAIRRAFEKQGTKHAGAIWLVAAERPC